MPQFDATIKHIKDGIKGFTVSAAVKNIEGWEATLQADKIDGEQVKKIVLKLGHETVNIAGKSDSKNAEKIKALGETLTHAAEAA
jgi:hypothetical protein